MNILIDTNIILFSMFHSEFELYYEKNYLNSKDDLIISVVTEGELKSLALQRNWAQKEKTI